MDRYTTGMMKRAAHRRHGGHTLIELVVGMTVASMLLLGLGATVYVASRTASTPGLAGDVLDASKAAYELVDELTYAVYVTERSATAVEFLVADRTGDGRQDVIRYEWSGTPGDPLLRTFNRSDPRVVAEGVEEFALQYDVKEDFEDVPTSIESDETLLASHTALLHDHSRNIQEDDWAGQYFHPDDFSPAMPSDAIGWSITKATFQAAVEGNASGELLVQLREAGGDKKPTSNVLSEERIAESSLNSSYTWREVVFRDPITGLHPDAHSCLVIAWGAAAPAGKVRRNDHAGSNWLETTDYGASWSLNTSRNMYYMIHGTVTTPGPTREVARHYLSGVRVSLRSGTDARSRVDTAAQVLNTPELLSGYWKLDFDADPTTLDVNNDGQDDWVRHDGNAFDVASFAGGIWQTDGQLDTHPPNDFAGVTTVEVRFRNTSIGGQGAVFRINADWAPDGTAVPIYATLTLQADGTQTLEAFRKDNDLTPVRLVTVPGLKVGFVDLRMVIDPAVDVVAIWVDGASAGSYTYKPYTMSGDERFASLFASGSSAEFDYVSIRVGEKQ